jgi:hypothetical protein
MKTIFTTTAAFFACITLCLSQGKSVPQAVKDKFASLYPNVKKVEWEKEDANFEAEFEINGSENCCVFDASGNLLITAMEISISDLPKAASDYMAKNFTGKKITEAARIVDSKNIITYEAEVKGVGDLVFDASGNFVKKEDDKEDDDDDDEKEKK